MTNSVQSLMDTAVTPAIHPLDIAMRNLAEERGWWHGYHGEPGLIRVSPFQADYTRGYQDGWRYAHHN